MRRPLLALSLAVVPLTGSAAQSVGAATPRPLSLEEALQLSGPASETLGLARAGLTRARGEQLKARSELFPQLSGSASYSRLLESQYSSLSTSDTGSTGEPPRPDKCDRFFADATRPIGERVDSLESSLECFSALSPFSAFKNLPFGRKNTWNLGLSLSQNLFTGGRVRGQIQAAVAGRRSAELGVTAADAQRILDVVQAYFDAALAGQLARIATTALEQADSTLRETALRRELGTVPEFDLLRARVTRDNQRTQAIQRASEEEMAHLRLKQLLELPATEPLELTTALDSVALTRTPALQELLATDADTLAEHRAPVRQAMEAVVAQQGLVKVARSQHLPSLALTSAYGRVAYPASGIPGWNDFLTNWSVAVGLQWPLFTGGRIKGDKLTAQAGLDEARLRLRQSEELARLDSRSALQQLGTARQALLASEGTEDQANRAYQIAEIRFREGISTHTELLDARLALEQARANRAQAERDAAIARVRVALIARLPLAVAGTTASTTTTTRTTARQGQTTPAAATGSGIP